MPFKSSVLVASDSAIKSTIKIRCLVEDELNNQIVFKIGADPPATILTYRLSINDLDPDRMSELNAINRTIDYARVEIAPQQNKKDRFLLSAFNNFAPDIDQVTIRTSHSEIKFIGSTSPLYPNRSTLATSEFTHKRDDFSTYSVKEEINITVPLRYLKLFLNFVETNKIQTYPKYIFEGMGLPAHFMYDAQLFKAHFVSATPFEYIPDELGDNAVLPIAFGEPNESFIADENVIQAENDDNFDLYTHNIEHDEDDEYDDDGYNDNVSECSEYIDGNLDRINPTANPSVDNSVHYSDSVGNNNSIQNNTHNQSNSVYGAESIRSEMKSEVCYDPEKVREVLNLDQDPDEIENVVIQYSSDSSED